MLLVVFLTRAAMGFQFQSIAAITPFLVPAFDLSYAQVGLLMGLFLLPGTVIALPGGLLGQRFGSLRVTIAGLGLMVLGGMVVAYSQGLGSAALGRALAGTGGVLLNIMLARMVAEWFRGRELQTAMGIMLSAWPFGMALALAALGPLAAATSWRLAEYVTVVGAGLALALMALATTITAAFIRAQATPALIASAHTRPGRPMRSPGTPAAVSPPGGSW